MIDLLRLAQWLSPAFPVGGFAYSHGLEVGIATGEIAQASDVQAWLTDILRLGAGHTDAVLLAAALRGVDPKVLTAEARALAPTRERWVETDAQGRAFAQAVTAATGDAVPEVPLPIAVGVASRGLDLPLETVISLYLQSFAANLVSAAVRFVPLGQAEGQRIVTALQPVITDIAGAAQAMDVDAITSFVPRADHWAAAHETLEVRMFKS